MRLILFSDVEKRKYHIHKKPIRMRMDYKNEKLYHDDNTMIGINDTNHNKDELKNLI